MPGGRGEASGSKPNWRLRGLLALAVVISGIVAVDYNTDNHLKDGNGTTNGQGSTPEHPSTMPGCRLAIGKDGLFAVMNQAAIPHDGQYHTRGGSYVWTNGQATVHYRLASDAPDGYPHVWLGNLDHIPGRALADVGPLGKLACQQNAHGVPIIMQNQLH